MSLKELRGPHPALTDTGPIMASVPEHLAQHIPETGRLIADMQSWRDEPASERGPMPPIADNFVMGLCGGDASVECALLADGLSWAIRHGMYHTAWDRFQR